MKILRMGLMLLLFCVIVCSVEAQPGWAAAMDRDGGEGYLGHGSAQDVVVAKVNGRIINMAQLMKTMAEISRTKHGSQEISPLLAQKIKQEATERLIVEELSLQKAGTVIKSVPPERVEQRIAEVAKSYKTDDEFQRYVKDEFGGMENFKNYVTRYLALELFILQEFGPKVTVTDQEIQQAYERDKSRFFVTDEFVQVNDLAFFLDPNAQASKDQIAATIKTIKEKYDNDPRKLPFDGNMALEKNKPLNKEEDKMLYEAARGLKEYGWTEPIEVDGTLHVVQLIGYKPAVNKSLNEVSAYLSNELRKRKRQALINTWMAGLKQGATIEIMDLTL